MNSEVCAVHQRVVIDSHGECRACRVTEPYHRAATRPYPNGLRVIFGGEAAPVIVTQISAAETLRSFGMSPREAA